MEQQNDALELLDLIHVPAFCVKDGVITKVNPAAAACMIETGNPVAPLLHTGAQEYVEFSDGCLYLTLTVSGQQMGASVNRVKGMDVFMLEEETENARLQAMALAAKELRRPLSGVMATADQLLPAMAQDDSTQLQASCLSRGLYQLLRIIGNMSDAGTAAAAQLEIRDISALLDEIFRKAEDLTAHTGVKLQYSGCPQRVFTLTDERKLERMIWNILSNAIKFTPAGNYVSASVRCRSNRLYLSISDSGSGIADNLRGSMFTRYTRQPGIEDSRYGLGLGMVLIRNTAALHGGTVLVDQKDGGTRITVSFAIRQGEAALQSPQLRVDYAGERDHGLVELSDVLPAYLYNPKENN